MGRVRGRGTCWLGRPESSRLTGQDAAGEDGDEDGDEDEDDLAVAFEVLDLSRVLFEKQLDKTKTPDAAEPKPETDEKTDTEAKGKEAETEDQEGGGSGNSGNTEKLDPATRHIMERLADTHDLLAEISLENERYGFPTRRERRTAP